MAVLERGDFSTIKLLDAVTLTADFADNESDEVKLSPFVQMEFEIHYTMDATETNNSAVLKVLLSDDRDVWVELGIRHDASPSGGVVEGSLHKLRFVVAGNAGVEEVREYALPTTKKYMKIQAMEKGLASAGGVFSTLVRLSLNANL